MEKFNVVKENLEARGFEVSTFETLSEAAEYLNGKLDATTIGFGGSATVKASNVYNMLADHNTVFWHWEQEANEARANAMKADVYLTSANALAETGELVSIDGLGNRVSSMLFGHKKVIYVIGKNKLVPSYEKAVWRARNIAAPKRAAQFNVKTPCSKNADRCYDCKSPERICRGMVTMWGPTMGSTAEVILVNEELGL